jgi:hypothetical protein
MIKFRIDTTWVNIDTTSTARGLARALLTQPTMGRPCYSSVSWSQGRGAFTDLIDKLPPNRI